MKADVEEDEERVMDSSVEASDAEPAGSLAGIVMDMREILLAGALQTKR